MRIVVTMRYSYGHFDKLMLVAVTYVAITCTGICVGNECYCNGISTSSSSWLS